MNSSDAQQVLAAVGALCSQAKALHLIAEKLDQLVELQQRQMLNQILQRPDLAKSTNPAMRP